MSNKKLAVPAWLMPGTVAVLGGLWFAGQIPETWEWLGYPPAPPVAVKQDAGPVESAIQTQGVAALERDVADEGGVAIAPGPSAAAWDVSEQLTSTAASSKAEAPRLNQDTAAEFQPLNGVLRPNLSADGVPGAVIQVGYQEPSAPPAATGREYKISNIPLERFEQKMLDIWGNRLAITQETSGELKVSLPTPQRLSGAMRLDRANAKLIFDGPQDLVDDWYRTMTALDVADNLGRARQAVLDMQAAEPATIQKAIAMMSEAKIVATPAGGQPVRQEPAAAQEPNVQRTIPLGTPPGQPNVVGVPTQDPGAEGSQDEQTGLARSVQIQVIPELNAIIVNGTKEDVEYVTRVLNNLISSAGVAQPDIEYYPLKHVSGPTMASQLQTLYDNNFAPQQGPVTINATDQPNRLLLIGRKENLELVKRLIEAIDVPSDDQTVQFKTIRLKFMSAIDAKNRLDQYFAQTVNNQTSSPVTVIADFRSNTVVVKAGAANLTIAENLISQFDVEGSNSTNIVRIFRLRNAVAGELATVLQDAINGQQFNSGRGLIQQSQQGGLGGGGAGGGAQQGVTGDAPQLGEQGYAQSNIRSVQLKTIDRTGKLVEGKILFDVRVTSDTSANAVIVNGPEESMPLVAALIEQLDVIPDVELKVKVFQLSNGDATTLSTALQQLFGAQQQNQGGFQQGNVQSQLPLSTSGSTDGATLAGLRFSVDTRTNSIIVSGPDADLRVIEDLLYRLDEQGSNGRELRVYRFSNAPVQDIADSLNQYITTYDTVNANDPLALAAVEQTRRSLIVVPEVVTNSLLISTTLDNFARLEPVLQALDRRPPMVKVKVLIAQVNLNALDEFGVELGLQDSLLFDRGLNTIRYPFNQQALGNDNTAASLATRENLAGQALANLGMGRVNDTLGYGGLVLSAGNESVNILIRALKDRNAVRVLADPFIMTMDNLLARVQVGQRVPYVTSVNQANGVISNGIEFQDVGVIIEITPRVSPDGMIVMTVNATNSSLDPNEGVPIFTNQNGDVTFSPIINETTAETTVMARSGQTVAFSGLMQETKSDSRSGIPILSDLPAVGALFRFDSEQVTRTELLIVLTPYLLSSEQDIETVNVAEYNRMHWCLGDVVGLHGTIGYDATATGTQYVTRATAPVYYPDADPAAQQPHYINPDPTSSFLDGAQLPCDPSQPAAGATPSGNGMGPNSPEPSGGNGSGTLPGMGGQNPQGSMRIQDRPDFNQVPPAPPGNATAGWNAQAGPEPMPPVLGPVDLVGGTETSPGKKPVWSATYAAPPRPR